LGHGRLPFADVKAVERAGLPRRVLEREENEVTSYIKLCRDAFRERGIALHYHFGSDEHVRVLLGHC